MTRMLLITANPRHYRDLASLIGDDVETVSLNDVDADDVTTGSEPTIPETAMVIADRGAKASGLITIAEATGLFVDRLDGAPGIRSPQYASEDASDEENRDFLLKQLHDAPANGRSARLTSAVSVAHPDGRLQTFQSTLEGVIADTVRGVGGVGYEPLFELDDGMTIAELLPEQRAEVRPRALAVQQAQRFINELLAGEKRT